MQQQPQIDAASIAFRITALEQQVQQLQGELRLYVPQRENELQLKNIQEIVRRIESDVQDAKKQITGVNEKLETQEEKARERSEKQRKEQDDLQIRVLWGVVSFVLVIISGVLVYFFTHLP